MNIPTLYDHLIARARQPHHGEHSYGVLVAVILPPTQKHGRVVDQSEGCHRATHKDAAQKKEYALAVTHDDEGIEHVWILEQGDMLMDLANMLHLNGMDVNLGTPMARVTMQFDQIRKTGRALEETSDEEENPPE